MKRLIILFALMFASITFAQQYPGLSIDNILTKTEQKASGLHKLTTEEKEQLRILIIEKYLAGFEAGKQKGAGDSGTGQLSSEVIESQIDGDFEGWEGETVVKLMNGQIWQQSEYFYHYHYAFMPNVLIYKSGSGYKMKIKGIDKAVGVIRLR